jgi:hypothetical protein
MIWMDGAVLLKSVLCFCLLPLTTLVGQADDASETAKIHELLKLTKVERTLLQVQQQNLDNIKSNVFQQMFPVKLTPDQKAQVDSLADKVAAVMAKALSWNDIEPEYTKLYADTFTEQQIDDLLAFYRSPTGQVIVEKTPVLLKQSTVMIQKRMAAVNPELQTLLKDFMANAAKSAPNANPPQ